MLIRTIALATLLVSGVAVTQGFAQGAPQTVGIAHVDPEAVATGYRASQLIGSSVVNGSDETVGKIDDVIVTQNAKAPVAILSVGGFLGMGSKKVAVLTTDLSISKDKVEMPSATKDSLTSLPTFEYNKQ